MSGSDFKSDLKAAKKMRLPWWGGFALAIGCLPIVLLLDHFGKLNFALPILGSAASIGLLLVLKWEIRSVAWFWKTISLMAALHIPLIIVIPWTGKWVSPFVSGGIVSADFCGMLWILSVVRKSVERKNRLKQKSQTRG
jgi:hypothetical protein